MARQQHQPPEIQLDDLHPIHDGFTHAYKGTATAQGVIAHGYLDLVERGHWPPGRYQPHAYEPSFSYERLSKKGRMDPDRLRDIGHALIKHLRERMLAAMYAAGWLVVGHTNEGKEIWQHRSFVPAISSDQIPGAEVDTRMETLEQATTSHQSSATTESERETGTRSQTRLVHTRPVTFTCIQCGREVTEQRFPSHIPLYCSNPACKREANRRKTRARVAKYRQLHPDARKKKHE